MNGDLITGLQLANVWTVVGLIGALLFTSRWFVQFFHSRAAGKSSVPPLFWVMSSIGSLITLAYFIFGNFDLIGIISNLFPLFVSLYNIYLLFGKKDRRGDASAP